MPIYSSRTQKQQLKEEFNSTMHHDQNKLKNDGRLEKLFISFNSQPNEHIIGSLVPFPALTYQIFFLSESERIR